MLAHPLDARVLAALPSLDRRVLQSLEAAPVEAAAHLVAELYPEATATVADSLQRLVAAGLVREFYRRHILSARGRAALAPLP